MVNIAVNMIVYNSSHVLEQCLEQIYPHVYKIFIVEGPVKWWHEQTNKKVSTDGTVEILKSFPDPENKIKLRTGKVSWGGKDEMCNYWLQRWRDNEEEYKKIDYVFQIDADEVYKEEDIVKIKKILEEEKPFEVGIMPFSFYGGFDRYVGGYEQATNNFMRIFRYWLGAEFLSHRPPSFLNKMLYECSPRPNGIGFPPWWSDNCRSISSDELWNKFGISFCHYSYVFPSQVQQKMKYYESKVAIGKIIPDYFWKVYLPWVLEDPEIAKKQENSGGVRFVESLYCGVHEFLPEFRGDAYTQKFVGKHPEAIERDLEQLKERLEKELKDYV